MSKEFLKLGQLELNPAGYLVSKESKKPVNHTVFVEQQRNAEYIVKLAAAIKDKNFTAGKVDDLDAIKREVRASMNNGTKKYVSAPEKPTSKINEELVKFALDFNAYEDTKLQTEKINTFMNQFNSIDDVEQVGDYFSEETVKLSALYDVNTILDAVKIHIEKLK